MSVTFVDIAERIRCLVDDGDDAVSRTRRLNAELIIQDIETLINDHTHHTAQLMAKVIKDESL